MEVAIIASEKDIAGKSIYSVLVNSFNKLSLMFDGSNVYGYTMDEVALKLYLIKEETIFSDDLDKKLNADLFVFITRHSSVSGKPCFTSHVPGNWAKAEYGGKDKKLCIAPAALIRQAIFSFEQNNSLGWEVIQECTHHGPLLSKPCMFIEIGSTEKEWRNKEAAEIAAKSVIGLFKKKPEKCKTAFGIGGLHGMPNFKKLLYKGIAFGHVCPKYMLDNLDEGLIEQALEKTLEKVDYIVLDWKGLKGNKQRILAMLLELGLDYRKIKDF